MNRRLVYERRYAIVPWLIPAEDLRPQGEPETTIERGDYERIDGLLILGLPEGPSMLAIHATRGNGTDGGEITAALESTYRVRDFRDQGDD